MGDKTIPDEAPPNLESFDPLRVAGIDLPQSKRFQARLRRVWNRFIPFESQVSIYHNQGVVDSLSRSLIKSIFQHQNTAIISVSQLSHRSNSGKEVARSCTCPYCDAEDGYFAIPNSECHLPRLQYYQYITYQSQLYMHRCTTYMCHEYFVACIYMPINLD